MTLTRLRKPRNVELEVGDIVETQNDRQGVIVALNDLIADVMMTDSSKVELFSVGSLKYIPSAEDLDRRCSEVRREWSRNDEWQRRAIKNPDGEIPEWVKLGDAVAAELLFMNA